MGVRPGQGGDRRPQLRGTAKHQPCLSLRPNSPNSPLVYYRQRVFALPPHSPPVGSQVVVAESYARIFFRNCMSTGELYPVETDLRLCEELNTGVYVCVEHQA